MLVCTALKQIHSIHRSKPRTLMHCNSLLSTFKLCSINPTKHQVPLKLPLQTILLHLPCKGVGVSGQAHGIPAIVPRKLPFQVVGHSSLAVGSQPQGSVWAIPLNSSLLLRGVHHRGVLTSLLHRHTGMSNAEATGGKIDRGVDPIEPIRTWVGPHREVPRKEVAMVAWVVRTMRERRESRGGGAG